MSVDQDATERAKTWQTLYDLIRKLLQHYGTENVRRTGDYWVHDEDWGYPQQKIYIRNLDLLQPAVIHALQGLLTEFPNWEIVIAVSVPGPGDTWPDMGLKIRAREIVDGLQRQYFPKEFQSIAYERSRQGTDRD